MDRRIVFVLFLLVGTSAFAAGPVTPSRDSLSISVLRQLNMPTTGTAKVTTAHVYDALNQALVAVCRDFPALEKFDTVQISGSAEGGALNNDFLRLESVDRMLQDTARLPLRIIPIDSLTYYVQDTIPVQNKGDIKSPNIAYSWGKTLIVVPKYIGSATADTLFLVKYYAIDDKLTAATDSTVIDDQYLPALKFYACYLLECVRENYESASFWQGLYDKERNAVGKPRETELKK